MPIPLKLGAPRSFGDATSDVTLASSGDVALAAGLTNSQNLWIDHHYSISLLYISLDSLTWKCSL